MNRKRPEPVRILYAVIAALSALLGVAGLTDFLPTQVVFWLGVALAVLTAVAGEIVRNRVTPIADPHARDGAPLVPAPNLASPSRRFR